MQSIRDRFLARAFNIHPEREEDRNALYLVLEMFWASILGAVATFNAAFAIRLGAENVHISLLSAIPALMAVLVSIPAGQFLQRRARRAPWMLAALQAHRAGFLLVALAPLLRIGGIEPGLMVVIILIGISVPAHFFNVGWIAMLPDVVPDSRRAAVFAARNIINQATVSVMVFLSGQWLSAMPFPVNYQVLYVFGFLCTLVSMYYLLRIRYPESAVTAGSQPTAQPKPARRGPIFSRFASFPDLLRSVREAFTSQPAFLQIVINTLLHSVGVWIAAPLYALYFVRELEATDAWLGLNGSIASIATIAGFSLWRGLIARWGESRALKISIPLVGLYPLLVGLTPALTPILFFGMLNGLIVPGTNLSHFNTLLRVTPPDARPRYTAMYMTVMNTGAFFCPFLAVALADRIGIAPTLVGAGLLSMVGSTSFLWWPVKERVVE